MDPTTTARPVTRVMRLKQAETASNTGPKAVEASFHYVDEFLKMPHASLLIGLKLFPSTKDLVESMAVLYHAKRHFPELFNKTNAAQEEGSIILVVGDGETPRTSALFAVNCPSIQILAVDPWLKSHGFQQVCKAVKNLQIVARPIRGTRIRVRSMYIMMLHAHCSLDEVLVAIVQSDIKGVIVCPCCDYYEQQSLLQDMRPTTEVRDVNLCSKDNFIRIWKLPNGTASNQLRFRKKSTFLEKLNDVAPCSTTEKQAAFGIISHVRKLKNWVFFDLWQPVHANDVLVDRSLTWLSSQAVQGKLPKHRSLEEFAYKQCCISRAVANNSKSIRPGNLVYLSDMQLGSSTRHQYLLWFTGKDDLLVARPDLDCIYLDFVI